MNIVRLDSALAWQMGLQEPVSPVRQGIWELHADLMRVLCGIVRMVAVLLRRTIHAFGKGRVQPSWKLVHGGMLEVVWTMFPAAILLWIRGPSFSLLYSMDEMPEAVFRLKVVGRQWYWSYEYGDLPYGRIGYDSYLMRKDDLAPNALRMLEVDERVVLPARENIRLVVGRSDVIHSWRVPSLGVKIDRVPGRLNEGMMHILREGIFYGQCSELCGTNHGYMPIAVEAVSREDFCSWVKARANELHSKLKFGTPSVHLEHNHVVMPQLDLCIFFPLGVWTVLTVIGVYVVCERVVFPRLSRHGKVFRSKRMR